MENQVEIKKHFNSRKIIVEVVCYAYFLLFVYAACSKLLESEKFQMQLLKSPITTDFAMILAWLVPVTEIIIAVMLVVPRTVSIGLYAALALMTLFTAYIIAILNFSDSIPCSCGGVLEQLGWQEHQVFNLVFIIIAVLAILLKKTKNGSGHT